MFNFGGYGACEFHMTFQLRSARLLRRRSDGNDGVNSFSKRVSRVLEDTSAWADSLRLAVCVLVGLLVMLDAAIESTRS